MNVPDDILVAREKYLKALEAAQNAEKRVHKAEDELTSAQHAFHQTAAALEDANETLKSVAMDWLRAERPL